MWEASLDYLYDEAIRRPVSARLVRGDAPRFLRPVERAGSGTGRPRHLRRAPARVPRAGRAVRLQLAPSRVVQLLHAAARSCPRSRGEVLSASGSHQGVDVWAAGPVGGLRRGGGDGVAARARRVRRGSWGVLTSGGVMANIMAMTAARDVHLAGSSAFPSRRAGRGSRASACTRATRRTSRSSAGARLLGFPRETLRVLPSDDRVPPARRRRRRCRRRGSRGRPRSRSSSRRSSGSTNTGSVDLVDEIADVARARAPVDARGRRVRRRRAALGARLPTASPRSSEPTA